MNPIRLCLVTIFVSLGGLALESSLAAIGLPLAFVPELPLVMVLFVSFYESSPLGALLAFVAGLIVDISGGQLLGPWAGSFVLCFGMLSLVSDRVFIESNFSLMTFSGAFVIVSHVLFLLISFDPLSQLSSEWLILLGKAVATAVLAPLVFPLIAHLLSFSRVEAMRVRGRSSYR